MIQHHGTHVFIDELGQVKHPTWAVDRKYLTLNFPVSMYRNIKSTLLEIVNHSKPSGVLTFWSTDGSVYVGAYDNGKLSEEKNLQTILGFVEAIDQEDQDVFELNPAEWNDTYSESEFGHAQLVELIMDDASKAYQSKMAAA